MGKIKRSENAFQIENCAQSGAPFRAQKKDLKIHSRSRIVLQAAPLLGTKKKSNCKKSITRQHTQHKSQKFFQYPREKKRKKLKMETIPSSTCVSDATHRQRPTLGADRESGDEAPQETGPYLYGALRGNARHAGVFIHSITRSANPLTICRKNPYSAFGTMPRQPVLRRAGKRRVNE